MNRLLSVALCAALMFASVRWYQSVHALDICRQDLDAFRKLAALSIPATQQYNYVVLKEGMMISMVYYSKPGEEIAHRFRRLDSLGQEYAELCKHADAIKLSQLVNAYADSVRFYTDGDSLVSRIAQGILKGCIYRADQANDTLLRPQATLQLALLQSIATNELAGRISFCGGMDYVKNNPVLIPRRLEAKVGQSFEAQLFLANRTPVNFQVEAYINGQKCPLVAGIGKFDTVFNQSGIQELQIKVETKNPLTGEIHTSGRIQEVLVSN